jgi:hypothetical protein
MNGATDFEFDEGRIKSFVTIPKSQKTVAVSLKRKLTADEKEDMVMVPDEARLEEFVT